jgi:hypothetical protein
VLAVMLVLDRVVAVAVAVSLVALVVEAVVVMFALLAGKAFQS